jgi:hypothetical protein
VAVGKVSRTGHTPRTISLRNCIARRAPPAFNLSAKGSYQMSELNRTGILMTMSEARLNDLVYLMEKLLFFQPTCGGNACLRECDIRVVMDMVIPSRMEGRELAAILLPNEVAGASHTKTYQNVSFAHVFDTTLDYLEDHWMKQQIPLKVKQDMWDFCMRPKCIFHVIQTQDEAWCARQSTPPGRIIY